MPGKDENVPVDRMELTITALKQALDLVADAVVITDATGLVVYQNAASKELHPAGDNEELSMMLENRHDGWRISDRIFIPVPKPLTPIELCKQGSFGPLDFLIRTQNATFIAAYSGMPVKAPDGQTLFLILVISNVRTFNEADA